MIHNRKTASNATWMQWLVIKAITMAQLPDSFKTFQELNDWLNDNPEFAKENGIKLPARFPDEEYKEMIANGCTVNELRSAMNYPPIEGGERQVRAA